jgi:hypothetical protein
MKATADISMPAPARTISMNHVGASKLNDMINIDSPAISPKASEQREQPLSSATYAAASATKAISSQAAVALSIVASPMLPPL